MSKKIACDTCGKVHVDEVHKTCKGYICSDCVRATWGDKNFRAKDVVISSGGMGIGALLVQRRKE